MEYTVKVPAILGDTCNLSSVAQAMALKPATAAGGEWDEKTFDSMELRYSRWLREGALSGRLVTCDSAGIPTPWKVLMGGAEPVDVTVACCRAWVNLLHLNEWARNAGHTFRIQTESVPWIDHRGVVGGSFDAPLAVTIDDKRYHLGLKHHKVEQPVIPEVVATDSDPVLESKDADAQVGPKALTTTEIAECLNGLANQDTRWWKKTLGKMPKWLKECLVTHGSQGGSERRWNPVMLGLTLVTRSMAKRNSVRARFQTRQELQPWKDAWMTAEWQLPEE